MKVRLFVFLLLFLPLGRGAAQEQAKAHPCEPVFDPEEYVKQLREKEISLGKGINIRSDFDCGKAQIEGHSSRPLSIDEWNELRPWIVLELEGQKPLGRLEEDRVQDSFIVLNGMSYVVDRYERAYLQHRLDYKADGTPPTITDFLVYYPHSISGVVRELRPARPERQVTKKDGSLEIHPEARYFSVELDKGDWFFVSEQEFVKLKKGTKATFVGFGPVQQPVV